jgi:hypothetical protein
MLATHSDRRRGTAYLIVVGTTMIVGLASFGILQATRSRGRSSAESIDATVARQCAQDGVEAAKRWIRQDPNWRTNRVAGIWANNLPTGNGTVTIEVSDPVDGNMVKGQHDALLVKCTGKKGLARSILSVTLQAQPIPLPALAYAAHTAGEVHITSGKTLKLPGGVISTNDALMNEGTITGGIHVDDVTQLGTVTGTPIVTNAEDKALPASSVIDKYVALGTVISAPATIERVVLAPGHNPYGGGTNADGIYVINASSDITIKNARIHGTLVIITANRLVKIDDRVLLHPSRSDQPTLIIKGNAEFTYSSNATSLSETLTLTNFNPPTAPYNGSSNILPIDTYPSEIQGLVHVTGVVNMKQTSRIRGIVLAAATVNDSFKIHDESEIIYTPSLFTSPPQWYTTEVRMPVLRGSWLQPAN